MIGASQIGDDCPAHYPVDAFVLHHLHVGAFTGLFDAEEHEGARNRAPQDLTRVQDSIE
jgi:hypothetical protein